MQLLIYLQDVNHFSCMNVVSPEGGPTETLQHTLPERREPVLKVQSHGLHSLQ